VGLPTVVTAAIVIAVAACRAVPSFVAQASRESIPRRKGLEVLAVVLADLHRCSVVGLDYFGGHILLSPSRTRGKVFDRIHDYEFHPL
jgi:hypothetical protein